MKKPDEIMAEYLLKGGKMLAKTCNECGSPLFEYKGKTGCVVCEYTKQEESQARESADSQIKEGNRKTEQGTRISAGQGLQGTLGEEFALTIAALLIQARGETDAGKVIKIMKAVQIAAKAYATLSH